jgi:hypothetical protein
MEQANERVRHWTSGLLDLSGLGITELPELPAGVTILYCSYNCLTRLPDTLPAGLTCLVCTHTQLTSSLKIFRWVLQTYIVIIIN